MKKIIFTIFIITLVLFINKTFAEWSWITINIWTDLSPVFNWSTWEGITCNSSSCTLQPWFTSLQTFIWQIVKYFTFLAILGSVLFIIINGMQYSMSWLDQGMKDKAKERITKTLQWIILLLLSWTILNILFPWIYK